MARGKRFTHREWVYIGNHPAGENNVRENGKQEVMQHIGMPIDAEGLNQYNFFGNLAERIDYDGPDAFVEYNGYRVTRIKASATERDSFGYEYTHVYRVEKL